MAVKKKTVNIPIKYTQSRSLTRGTTDEKVHLRGTRAVAERNCASKRNEISRGDTVSFHEWLLQLDDLIEANIGFKIGLDFVEDHDGAVGTSAASWCREPPAG